MQRSGVRSSSTPPFLNKLSTNKIVDKFRLKERRENKGLSQAELARRVGVGRDSYNKYERAGVQPSNETLVLLASALDTTVDYLLGKSDIPNPTISAPDKAMPDTSEDIANDLEATVRELELAQDGLMFNGQPLDQETKEILIANLKHTIEMGKMFAKSGLPKTTDLVANLRKRLE